MPVGWARLAQARDGDRPLDGAAHDPAQREAFGRTQAVMSLLEGASNHVMHAVGASHSARLRRAHDRFEARHRRRGPVEQLVLRVTGLDLKLEQYAEGERFVAAVVARSGQAGFARVWRGLSGSHPGRDPRPESWLARAPMDSTTEPRSRARGGAHLNTPRGVRILTTPIFGAPLTPDLVACIEAVPGAHVTQISRDGLAHGRGGAGRGRGPPAR